MSALALRDSAGRQKITDAEDSAAGMRLGWLTGSPAMIERLQRIAETDSQEVK